MKKLSILIILLIAFQSVFAFPLIFKATETIKTKPLTDQKIAPDVQGETVKKNIN